MIVKDKLNGVARDLSDVPMDHVITIHYTDSYGGRHMVKYFAYEVPKEVYKLRNNGCEIDELTI